MWRRLKQSYALDLSNQGVLMARAFMDLSNVFPADAAVIYVDASSKKQVLEQLTAVAGDFCPLPASA